jgi:hypothetical protein
LHRQSLPGGADRLDPRAALGGAGNLNPRTALEARLALLRPPLRVETLRRSESRPLGGPAGTASGLLSCRSALEARPSFALTPVEALSTSAAIEPITSPKLFGGLEPVAAPGAIIGTTGNPGTAAGRTIFLTMLIPIPEIIPRPGTALPKFPR